ncbi:MAG: hydroxymethylglutaryl-CoA lyase [Alphaproteobacteria bacterium]|nr:hydroxymethylglutaryl-CoA lyase [Alphaproteobacteria bacterium]MCY4231997.1 hydroxymethylglutaryl-CoA lyase [Alphaproteobacteria bacterium]MCY4319131.1 hydroxymethylglutaryl-CoA lyase [Alphaproteobacteria bacterium]
MPDLPQSVSISEEGPREGFQIEPDPIPTVRKIELIDALSETGLKRIQVASFVSPKRVPGWADADEVVEGFRRVPGVAYSVLWLNERGLDRALGKQGIERQGAISTSASETFMRKNTNRGHERNREVQSNQIDTYLAHGMPVRKASVMAAFGCNFEGEIPVPKVLEAVRGLMEVAAEKSVKIDTLSLADTMGWAQPASIRAVCGAVREAWPAQEIALHLHDTRGMGIANAYAGLEMGVTKFDSSVAGLGGCPFAGHKGAAGNVCTEDLVFLCEEMGIDTGVDLDALIECARLAEDIVGHPLPGSVMHGGSLTRFRDARKALPSTPA